MERRKGGSEGEVCFGVGEPSGSRFPGILIDFFPGTPSFRSARSATPYRSNASSARSRGEEIAGARAVRPQEAREVEKRP